MLSVCVSALVDVGVGSHGRSQEVRLHDKM